jgi:hypothetical protein
MKRFLVLASSAPSEPDTPSLGAACVASAVKSSPGLREKVEVAVLQARPGEDSASFAHRAAALSPDILGLSLFVWNRSLLGGAARALRAELGKIPVIAGGPEAGGDPESVIADGTADCVIRGEGEDGVVTALEGILRGESPSSVIEGGTPRPASPLLDGNYAPEPGGRTYWETARGCPFSCAYCYEGRGGKGVRPFDHARLEAELDVLRESGAEEVIVLDPTFNADRKRCLRVLGLIAERGAGMRFGFEVRAEFMDQSLCAAFAKIPCWLQVGLQSADPDVTAALDRPFDPEAFARGARLMDKNGLAYGMDLIYGLPGDTLSGFKRSLDYALRLSPNHLDVFRLSVLPGTVLASRAAGLGLRHLGEPPYEVLSAPGFPEADIETAASIARAADLFYTKGRAVAWFLPVVESLDTGPSEFLESVRSAMKGGHPGPDAEPLEILEFQEACLEGIYRARGKENSLEAAKGLARLHAAYGMAVAEGMETGLEISYDPDELLREGPKGLASYAASRKPSLRTVVVGPDGEGGARID